MKCAACGASRIRSRQRALVLTGPGRVSAGLVCGPCAATGWLLVLGDPSGGEPRARKRVRAKHSEVSTLTAALSPHAAARGEFVSLDRLLGSDDPPRCDAVNSEIACSLPYGHTGRHRIERGKP